MIRLGAARFIALLWASLTALSLQAQADPLIPLHDGYAFDRPRVMVHQRLFGLAHSVSLLATACVEDASYSTEREAVLEAYSTWYDRQRATIDHSRNELARYYFGERAAEADLVDIVQVLKLKARLGLASGSKELRAACDTFAEAVQKPRYDLHQQYHLQSQASRLAAATATETEAATCRAVLAAEERVRLDAAISRWNDAYGDKINEARTLLEQNWPDAQLDGTLDEWLVQAKENGRRAAQKKHADAIADNATSCAMLSSWLLTTQADPDDEFRSNP